MSIPFSKDQFLGVFEQYNLAVWPVSISAYLLGIAGLLLAIKKRKYSDQIICSILSFLWFWSGGVYHWMFFTSINPLAYGFGVLFVIQSILFLLAGVFKSNISFQFKLDRYSITGSLFMLYAMVIYPILGYLLGHGYPQSPTFGVPGPTTIFTFGLLLWTGKRIPKLCFSNSIPLVNYWIFCCHILKHPGRYRTSRSRFDRNLNDFIS